MNPEPSNKYFGSVTFFKHLILSVISIVFIILIASCTLLVVKNHTLKNELKTRIYDVTYLKSVLELNKSKPELAIELPTYDYERKPVEYTSLSNASFDYQLLYPDMYVDKPHSNFQPETSGTVYMTFDDGPSKYTSAILDILKKYNVKATFFTIYNDSEEAKNLYKRIIAEGHELGVHSTTHDYNKIYKSTEAFLDDFSETENLIYDVTGVKAKIFRFPGGSINSYNHLTYKAITAEMLRRGYLFYDWNVNAADAEPNSSVHSIFINITENALKSNYSIVLMHDTKAYTLEALPSVLENLQKNGAVFKKLDNTVKPITFSYID